VNVQLPDRPDPLSRLERIQILLEEYRSLNSLLLFRLAAMDRRLPVSVGIITAAMASILVLPAESRTALLIVIPPALFWLVRSTVQHARAKEDHLRRIDEVERAINCIAGEQLLVFQSHHPSGSRVAAGRTGAITVVAVSSGAFAMLVLCVLVSLSQTNLIPPWLYVTYILVVAIDVIRAPFALSRYCYRRPTTDASSA